MEKITSKQELHNIIENNERDSLICVKFSANWCSPCKQLNKTIEKIESEEGNTTKFYHIDVDELPELAEEYDIMSIPVIIFFKGTLQVDRTTGALPEKMLKEKITENNNK